jgi:ABC-type transport system involved in cytochrome bd biosynthesis fused ATPase/permease subunit
LDLREWRARVAYLPQSPYLPPASVRVAMQLLLPETNASQVRAALERVDLWPILSTKCADDPLSVRVDELSAGERQRVAIARVLARDAELYVFDEPDANLDRNGVSSLVKTLGDLSKRAAVVVAAHTPEVVALATHIIELDGGRIIRDDHPTKGTVTEVLHEDTPS